MANVQVMGIPRDMPGLKGSLATFTKHHIEVGDALLNIAGVGTKDGKMADVEEPRPRYVHQDFPKMLYHADGREEIVDGPDAMKEIEAKGFRTLPYPKPQVAIEDPKVEKQRLIDDAAKARADLAKSTEIMQAMMARLEALEAERKAAPAPAAKR